jgi:hypothetical protein
VEGWAKAKANERMLISGGCVLMQRATFQSRSRQQEPSVPPTHKASTAAEGAAAGKAGKGVKGVVKAGGVVEGKGKGGKDAGGTRAVEAKRPRERAREEERRVEESARRDKRRRKTTLFEELLPDNLTTKHQKGIADEDAEQRRLLKALKGRVKVGRRSSPALPDRPRRRGV